MAKRALAPLIAFVSSPSPLLTDRVVRSLSDLHRPVMPRGWSQLSRDDQAAIQSVIRTLLKGQRRRGSF